MRNLYFDESKHTRGGFTLGAFVIAGADAHDAVAQALTLHGLVPGVDEFKSGKYMSRNPAYAAIRDDLVWYVEKHCSLAVVVVPSGDDTVLGEEALRHLPQVLKRCSEDGPVTRAFFDKGLFRPVPTTSEIEDVWHRCELSFEQDSRHVLGIQLADAAAHVCSLMLLAKLGLVYKQVNEFNPSTNEQFAAPVEWEYWYRFRRRFLCQPLDREDPLIAFTEPYGLAVSPDCSTEVAEAARETFGQFYVGCTW